MKYDIAKVVHFLLEMNFGRQILTYCWIYSNIFAPFLIKLDFERFCYCWCWPKFSPVFAKISIYDILQRYYYHLPKCKISILDLFFEKRKSKMLKSLHYYDQYTILELQFQFPIASFIFVCPWDPFFVKKNLQKKNLFQTLVKMYHSTKKVDFKKECVFYQKKVLFNSYFVIFYAQLPKLEIT